MFYKIKCMVILLLGCIAASLGCGKAGNVSVSLEEALISNNIGEKTEADMSGMDDLSTLKECDIYVYICGAVSIPGVYELEAGSRIVAAVEAAGGFLPDAATEAVNLAELLQDGMQITVPTKEEASAVMQKKAREEAGLINLNTATAEELCTLSGIGEAKAEAILAYRTEIGVFISIEQLKEVTGIGESLFNQIKSSVYIE